MPVIYLIGSLRNPEIPKIGNILRQQADIEVFDQWFAAGPEADDSWRDYENAVGHSFKDALKGHPARHVFDFDEFHLNRVHGGILVMPAGKSGHLELAFLSGQKKPTWILFDQTPDRYDVMVQFATAGICTSIEDLVVALKKYSWPKHQYIVDLHLTEAMWLAGLLEGEGTFVCDSQGGKRPRPRIALQMTDKDTVEKVASFLNSPCWGPRIQEGKKPVWATACTGLKAAEYMRVLKPYMSSRRQQRITEILDIWNPHSYHTWRKKGG